MKAWKTASKIEAFIADQMQKGGLVRKWPALSWMPVGLAGSLVSFRRQHLTNAGVNSTPFVGWLRRNSI
jgi:hypothetical protein